MTFRILPPSEWNRLTPLLQSESELAPGYQPAPPVVFPDLDSAVFVLEEDGEILAMRVVKQIAWAGGMYVHPNHRRKKLATILQNSVEEALRGAGVRQYFMCPSDRRSELTVESFGLTRLPLTLYTKEM
jgi:GNAT superfamily N-acetyltransferase